MVNTINHSKHSKEWIEWELLNLLDEVFAISFTADVTPADFEKYTIVWPKFLEILLSKNREWYYAEILVQNVIKIISEKNLQKNFPHVPKIFIWKIWYELFTWVIAYCFQKGIKSDYVLLQKMKHFSDELNTSKINELFPNVWYENLVNLNNQLVNNLVNYKTRDLPLSFILEIPVSSNQRYWILYEQKWKFTSQNLKRWKESWEMDDIFLKVWDNIHQLRDSYVTIFFWDKEPHPVKINTVQNENSETSLTKAVFRDQIGTIIFYAGMFFDSCISLTLWKQAEKLKALILLWIAPVLLRKELVEEIYKSYGIDFKTFDKKTSYWNWDDEKWVWNWVRNYPYDNTLKLKISDLFDDEDRNETNTRVTHKRLLPALKRPDGSYMSAKPSQRARDIATEKWFTLGIGLWFQDKEKCIYPEKIDDLLKTLEVTNIHEALEKLLQMWENCVLRYETLVVPSIESQEMVEKTIKAKVWWIL